MVVGIMSSIISNTRIETLADDLPTVDAMFFLIACFLSYWALRSRTVKRMHRVEKFADGFFLIGLCMLAVACVIITYVISAPPPIH